MLKPTLRVKLVIAFLAVALVPLAALIVLNNQTIATTNTASTGATMHGVANSQASAIGDQLARQVDALLSLGANTLLQDGVEAANSAYPGDADQARARLAELDSLWQAALSEADPLVKARLTNNIASELSKFHTIIPDHVEIVVTDQHGGLVAASRRLEHYSQAGEAWWQAAWSDGQGAIYIGQPAFDESSETFSIKMAVPVYARGVLKVVGVLRSTYRFIALRDIAGAARLGRTGRADLLLPDGHIVTFEDERLMPLDAGTLERLAATAGLDYAVIDYQGAPRVVSQAPVSTIGGSPAIDALGWKMVVHQDRQESLVLIEAQARLAGWLTAAVIVLVIGAALGMAHVLASPIVHLTGVAQQIAAGDLSARARSDSGDEIGALAANFNRMTAQLGDLIENLEEKVAARTMALEAQNEYLNALHKTTLDLVSHLDLTDLLEAIVARAAALAGTEHGYIYLLEPGEAEMQVRVGIGTHVSQVGYRIRPGEGLAGRVWQTGQPLVVDDYSTWSGRVRASFGDTLHAVAGVPLTSGSQVMGVIALSHVEAGRTFDKQQVEILNRFASLASIALDNARLYANVSTQVEREMAIARQIQTSLLPAGAPEIDSLQVSGVSQAAYNVGGDFYNYFVFEPGQLGIAVGDVSGKGMQAALMMALSFGLLINRARGEISPADLLDEMNQGLYPHTQRNHLNTALCYAVLRPAGARGNDGQAWELRVANAGVISPLVRRRDGQVEWLPAKGVPLGAMDEVAYQEVTRHLAPGDVLVLCSDGIVEAMNSAGEMYSFERLAQRLAAAAPTSAGSIQDAILQDVDAFTGQVDMYDDLTLVVVLNPVRPL